MKLSLTKKSEDREKPAGRGKSEKASVLLAGTNVDKGNKILRESKIKYIEANSLEDAANKAVKILK